MDFLFHIPQYTYNPKISKFYGCLYKGFKLYFSGSGIFKKLESFKIFETDFKIKA